jgi:hypothetical protein
VFGPDALDGAVEYLGLTTWERVESARSLDELQKGLGLDVVRLRAAAAAQGGPGVSN